MGFKEMNYANVDWINLAKDKVQSQAAVNFGHNRARNIYWPASQDGLCSMEFV
jgi:hypothetical protein